MWYVRSHQLLQSYSNSRRSPGVGLVVPWEDHLTQSAVPHPQVGWVLAEVRWLLYQGHYHLDQLLSCQMVMGQLGKHLPSTESIHHSSEFKNQTVRGMPDSLVSNYQQLLGNMRLPALFLQYRIRSCNQGEEGQAMSTISVSRAMQTQSTGIRDWADFKKTMAVVDCPVPFKIVYLCLCMYLGMYIPLYMFGGWG